MTKPDAPRGSVLLFSIVSASAVDVVVAIIQREITCICKMEKIDHLWKVIRFLADMSSPEANGLRTHYARRCKLMGKVVGLPKNCFGPQQMCYYCDSMWTNVDHRIRIASGRKPSHSIRKLLRNGENHVGRLPKVRATLSKKYGKKQENRMIIKCSVCLMKTKIPFEKPERTKPPVPEMAPAKVSNGKKKKRSKDKTAGLKIPTKIATQRNVESDKTEDAPASISITTVPKRVSNTITPGQRKTSKSSLKPLASISKSKKPNITRLKSVLTKCAKSPKKSRLHSFLKELR